MAASVDLRKAALHTARSAASVVCLAFIFANAMRGNTLTAVNTAWQCGNVFLLAMFGIIVLKERISLCQKVGVVFAFVSMLLMFF